MSSVEEILAQSRKLREKPPELQDDFRLLPIKYPRITKVYCVLAPVDYEWQEITIDVYTDSVKHQRIIYEPATTVLHGHPVGLYCYAPNFCHVAEYSPVGNESPVFLKLFKEKWG